MSFEEDIRDLTVQYSDSPLWFQLQELPHEIVHCEDRLRKAHIAHEAARDEWMRRGHSVPSLEDVHGFFGLSYSNYLVVPRVLMEAMPIDWQRRFCGLVEEVREVFDFWEHPELNADYEVRIRGTGGRYQRDPLSEYRRPDRDYIESLKRKSDDPLRSLVGYRRGGTGEAEDESGEGDGQQDTGGHDALAAVDDALD